MTMKTIGSVLYNLIIACIGGAIFYLMQEALFQLMYYGGEPNNSIIAFKGKAAGYAQAFVHLPSYLLSGWFVTRFITRFQGTLYFSMIVMILTIRKITLMRELDDDFSVFMIVVSIIFYFIIYPMLMFLLNIHLGIETFRYFSFSTIIVKSGVLSEKFNLILAILALICLFTLPFCTFVLCLCIILVDWCTYRLPYLKPKEKHPELPINSTFGLSSLLASYIILSIILLRYIMQF